MGGHRRRRHLGNSLTAGRRDRSPCETAVSRPCRRPSPCSTAQTAMRVRERRSSLVMMCSTWLPTVFSVITSAAEISRLERPRAINAVTSRSRRDSAGPGSGRTVGRDAHAAGVVGERQLDGLVRRQRLARRPAGVPCRRAEPAAGPPPCRAPSPPGRPGPAERRSPPGAPRSRRRSEPPAPAGPAATVPASPARHSRYPLRVAQVPLQGEALQRSTPGPPRGRRWIACTWPSLCRAEAIPGVPRSSRHNSRLSGYSAAARSCHRRAEPGRPATLSAPATRSFSPCSAELAPGSSRTPRRPSA